MTISRVSYSVAASPVSAVTSLTVTAPSSLTPGNILVAALVVGLGGQGQLPTPPGGWTSQAVTDTASTANGNIGIWTHVVGSSEPSSYTWTWNYTAVAGLVVAQYSGNDLLVVSGSGQAGAPGTVSNFDWSAVSNSYPLNQAVLLSSYTGNNNVSAAGPYATPTGFTVFEVFGADAAGAVEGGFEDASITPSYTYLSPTLQSATMQYASVQLAEGATAPNAPILQAPANASSLDASGGVVFQAAYSATDTYNQNAYAAEIELSGAAAFSFYNASTNALQSTEVFNSSLVAPGASWSWAIPGTALANGNTYVWSARSQEAGANLQGPYASTFTFNTAAAPSLTVSYPTGTVVSAAPALGYTATPASGDSIQGGRWLIYTTAATQASGFSIDIGEGVIPAGAISDVTWTGNPGSVAMASGASLLNHTGYTAYAAVYETGTIWSSTVSSACTVTFDSPATPTITATPTTDPATGCPMIQVTVQGHDNLLSAVDASFETGVGTWVPGGETSLSQSSAEALDGSYSLALTADVASAQLYARTGPYPVLGGASLLGMASVRAAATAEQFEAVLEYWQNGAFTGSVSSGVAVTDTVGGWTTVSVSGEVPASGVDQVALRVMMPTAVAASGEVHYIDCAGIFPGTVTEWTAGGFAGVGQAIVTRTDQTGTGLGGTPFYVRGASQANPATLPTPSQQAVLNDYELVPGHDYTYQATTQVVVNSATTLTSPPSAPSAQQAVTTSGWWELDPTNPSSAVSAQVTNWQPVNTLPAAAHQVMGQKVMNFVTDVPLNQDFSATFEIFNASTYDALEALLTSSATLFISSPFSATDTGWFNIGPQSGGLSTGAGVQTKQAQLMPSTASAPHRTVQVTAIAAARPST